MHGYTLLPILYHCLVTFYHFSYSFCEMRILLLKKFTILLKILENLLITFLFICIFTFFHINFLLLNMSHDLLKLFFKLFILKLMISWGKRDLIRVISQIDQVFKRTNHFLHKSHKFSILFSFIELITILKQDTKVIYQSNCIFIAY